VAGKWRKVERKRVVRKLKGVWERELAFAFFFLPKHR